jgi:hypothetical protein
MAITQSKIQANYATTILRVARGSDIDVAIRLLEGLTIDIPTSDVTAEQSRRHSEAIEVYKDLLAALREGGTATAPWAAAYAATERWRSVT